MLSYGKQNITNEDIDSVVEVLKSDFLTQGPCVPKFEQAIAEYTTAKKAIAVNSGTSALHIACLALNLQPNDIVWTSPISFVASANCALYCGANINFVDIDKDTWNLSVSALKEKLHLAKKHNKLPKIVIPVHLAGQPTEQESIWELGQEFGFKIIEDASHSLGALRKDERVGSCRWSDITTFSFHPVKMITTGEGGAAATNDDELAWKMDALRSHGITRDAERMEYDCLGPWYYEQLMLGFNYRMTDLQAALGLSQLIRLDQFVSKRNEIAQKYNEEFSGLNLKTQFVQTNNYSSYHLFIVEFDTNNSINEYREIFTQLKNKGVGVNQHYMPIYKQPYFRNILTDLHSCPEAEQYSLQAITIPLHTHLTEKDQDYIIECVKNVINA